MVLVDVVWA